MQWARDTQTGHLVTLEAVYRARLQEIDAARGSRGASDKIQTILSRDVVCPECAMRVHAYGKSVLSGFYLAGEEMGNPDGRPMTSAKYVHYPHNRKDKDSPTVLCSLYLPADPNFANLRRKSTGRNKEIRKLVLKTLCHTRVKGVNQNILNRLWYQGARRSLTRADVDVFNGMAKDFLSNEFFLTHPYVLPFVLAVQTKAFGEEVGVVYDEQTGRPVPARYRTRGQQYLRYVDLEGKDRVSKIPRLLELVAVDEHGAPMRRGGLLRQFTIGQDTMCRLGGVDKLPAPPKWVKVVQYLPGPQGRLQA